ncbi:ribonuclease H [Fusarium coicis]|nr:ribonuclease H [Fusarium coicis]
MDNQDFEHIELDDGRLVCSSHGLVICGRCCVDYSFMDNGSENSDDEPYQPANKGYRKGSSYSLYAAFFGHNSHLVSRWNKPESDPQSDSFHHHDDPKTFLIYTDGACLNNGQENPRAGWAFVFRPRQSNATTYVTGRLENKGPFGDDHSQTSNRAELRAIIGALRFRHWNGEGFTRLVFATDSEYVVKGATAWVAGWLRKGWKTSSGHRVKNRDLWEALLGELERWNVHGMRIQFWKIPREWNIEADQLAKEAARGANNDEFTQPLGVLC